VAVLLEIGRALKAKPPRDRVTLVLFDGEDYGTTTDTMFFGSRRFARRYHGPAISWAVLLDMVGDRDLRIPKEQISLTSARGVVGRVWKAAADVDAKAFVEARGPAILDDHVLLLQHGIPCVDVIDFDYPYWHTTADTPDKCSAESLEQVGRTVLRTISDFESEGDQKGQ
jgi:Zn-dependent M28 family amino/carboxypeptidase